MISNIKDALILIPEYAPDRQQECADLLRHIEHGDTSLYTKKSITRLSEYLHSYSPAIPDSVRHDIIRAMLSAPETIVFSTIRILSGLTQADMSVMFNIPKRTIENWDSGARACPEYVSSLILYRLCNEGYIDLPISPAE